MIKFLELSLYGVLLASLLGPSIRFPLPLPLNLYLSDLFLCLMIIVLLFHTKQVFLLIKRDPVTKAFLVLTLFFGISMLISPLKLTGFEFFVSGMYLLRYFAYFFVYISAIYLKNKSKNFQYRINLPVSIIIFGFISLGWLQYFLYPDLRNLSYLGWDPHYKRIFALILDPNYFGIILVLLFLYIIAREKIDLKGLFLRSFLLLTIGFTYSRSTYLAFFAALIYYAGMVNKLKLFLFSSLILIPMLILLPRPGGVGVQLERLFSAKERLANWQNAVKTISSYPFSGIGFNSLRFIDETTGGNNEKGLRNNSGGGVDNSFLFVAVTSGLTGLGIYIYFLFMLYKNTDTLGKSVLLASVVHSMFLNSMFFVFVLIWLWTITALGSKLKVKENSEL